ncbi:hypothetical protein COLO4_09592 [Corchorus olitorius]|uniref:Uncharacterized protein n=1 Tax=Corchorus olitorius TaxID=93759 RepID=A0A1R3KBQ5_9ROSI|nr:hypothetical protein COLO4_09592 [Corchorus olitorius]
MVYASDPDIISDFLAPANSSYLDGNFFTYTGLRGIFSADYPPEFKVTKASMAEFPALNGQTKGFKTDAATIDKLKAGLGSKARK